MKEAPSTNLGRTAQGCRIILDMNKESPSNLPSLERIAEDFSKGLSKTYEQIKIRVFLCGAGINPNEEAPSKTGSISRSVLSLLPWTPGWLKLLMRPKEPLSKTVRHRIYHMLKQVGCETLLGEHEALSRAAKGVLKAGFTLADFEMDFAVQKQTDLIIIFPSSEGSFAELGMFAMNEDISKKMVILFENNPNHFSGFVYQGPVMAAKNRKAEIKLCDYNKFDEIWAIIKECVEIMKVVKRGRTYGIEP